MIHRLLFSASFALLGFVGGTAPAFADLNDRDDVMIWTAVVALATMAVLSLAYAAKLALGLVRPAPPPVVDEHASGHH